MSRLFSEKQHEKGAGLIEYTLLLSFVAIAVTGAVRMLGPRIHCIFTRMEASFWGTADNLDSACGMIDESPDASFADYVAPTARGRGNAVKLFCENTPPGTHYILYTVGEDAILPAAYLQL